MENSELRKHFDLPEEDQEHLDARGLPWEAVSEGGNQWLLIRNFPVPKGYNNGSVTAAVRIPANYPNAGLDMVYFHPTLSRTDGIRIPATEGTVYIDNSIFQQWSRHRTVVNPWRPGVDQVSTHLSLVEEWLLREFVQNR